MWRQTSELIVDDFCNCGHAAVKKTCWTDPNAGRRYSACAKHRELGGCTYFIWIDPPMCMRSRQVIPGLRKRVDRLEAEIRRKNIREKMLLFVLLVSWIVVYLSK
ncbi:GRF zinc finger containing protein [Striga asiatica]|uniref:GRF zinc finger containing protein n=1 Tax=Striga asiatica TaxID=4170 RepID=A0A5A7Q7B0_STRAF|nr:GRF zinc finger containing protein [Striga asiatica]